MPYNTLSFFSDELSGDWLMTPKEFSEMQRNEFADLSIERIGEILVGNIGDIDLIPELNFNPVKVSIQNNSNFTQIIKNDLGVYVAKNIDNNELYNELLNVIDEKNEYEFNSFEICLIDAMIRNCDEKDISNYIYQLKNIDRFGEFSMESIYFFIKLNIDLKANHLLENNYNVEKLSIEEYYKLVNKEFKLDDQNLSIEFSRWKRLLTFDFIDENGRKFTDLSYGEKVLFGQMINFKYRLKEEERREKDLFEFEFEFEMGAETLYHKPTFIFLIDEPDVSLHPQWQKEYFSLLFDTLHGFEADMHIVFTTHSPFLLSDIPKQNIIFLDVDENKNCKVLTHDEVFSKKQTFGQNIHTLLSDSFFMDEGGLMGEFAKRKINKIIEYLRDDSENKSFVEDIPKYDNWLYDKENLKKIIDAIGEPFLQHKILELYYDKFTDDATEAERKKELLKQKERIERELSRYD